MTHYLVGAGSGRSAEKSRKQRWTPSSAHTSAARVNTSCARTCGKHHLREERKAALPSFQSVKALYSYY